MLISIFKSNQKIVNTVVVLLAAIMWLPSFWCDANLTSYQNSLFYYIKGLNENVVLNYVVSVMLVSFQAIYLNSIANQQKLVQNNTHLIALFYVVLISIDQSILNFNPALLVNTFIIIIIDLLLKIYNQTQINGIAFNAGILIGLSMLIYFPLIVLFPFLWFTLVYLGTPKWRSFVISIIGLLLPLIYYVVYFFLTDELDLIKSSFGINNILFEDLENNKHILSSYYVYSFALIGLFTLAHLFKTVQFDVVKVRKSKMMILVLTVLLIAVSMFGKGDFYAMLILISVPCSVFFADFFNELKRKWLAELLFILLLGSVAINYFS